VRPRTSADSIVAPGLGTPEPGSNVARSVCGFARRIGQRISRRLPCGQKHGVIQRSGVLKQQEIGDVTPPERHWRFSEAWPSRLPCARTTTSVNVRRTRRMVR